MLRLSSKLLLTGLGLSARQAHAALTVDLDSQDSIKQAAAQVAEDLLTFYHGDEPGMVPGILPGPPPDGDYYWWQGGAMWGTLLDYRHSSSDKTHDTVITQAMLFQVGDDKDYNPRNWSASMGNDDQAFWALSAMLAAETGYTDPPKDQPQWLALAQAVWNEQTHEDRHAPNTTACAGGLRWQVYPSNQGYDYINTIANACYFNIGARLARYTNNDTYAQKAEDTFAVLERLTYIDKDFNVYDGAHLPDCTEINKAQFSYNAAMLMQGAAFMYNYTNGAQVWRDRIQGLMTRTIEVFFPNGVAVEPSCEPDNCNADMRSYRGFMHRWMASTTQLAPFTYDTIMPVLKSSVAAGVATCTGGANGRFCGFRWSTGAFDGRLGAGSQMNMLGGLTALMATPGALLTNNTGGTSVGDPNAGSDAPVVKPLKEITTGDRAGAGLITTVLVAGALGAFAWMSLD